MSQESNIEWTDATWNPVRGCVRVSPGCANCYAETFAERFRGVAGHPYEQGFDLRLVPEKIDEPLRWKKPRRVFVNSMSDLFQDGVPDEFIDSVFAVMALAPQHTFQVLTKRAERMRAYMNAPDVRQRVSLAAAKIDGDPAPEMVVRFWPLLHVWLGVSVENGRWKSRVIPELVSTPAAVRFVSVEPLLEDLGDISDWFPREREVSQTKSVWIDGVNWVIVGGESGHEARPFDIAWARSIVAQCQAAGCPVFVKQLGSNAVSETDGIASSSVSWNGIETKFAKGERGMDYRRLKSAKGGDPSEWPADLRIRQFPAERTVSRGTS